MAQKRYSKLKFDSTLESDHNETSDDSDVENASKSKPVPPQEEKSVGHNNHIETSDHTETSDDPFVVMTRDYCKLAESVGGNHSCLIVVTNGSNLAELRDPVVFTKVGHTRIPPDSKIPPQSSTYCAFKKPSIRMKGTSGVISYEYDRCHKYSKRFAIMWKIPYQLINREENEVALKWIEVDLSDPMESTTHTSGELFKEMASCDDTEKGRNMVRAVAKNGKSLCITNVENGAELSATFSGNCKAIVKVDFRFEDQT